MDDVRAVMEPSGSERRIFGVSEGGPMSMLFAATYPERDPRAGPLRRRYARRVGAARLPMGADAARSTWRSSTRRSSTSGAAPGDAAPGRRAVADDDAFSGVVGAYLRLGASPAAAAALFADERARSTSAASCRRSASRRSSSTAPATPIRVGGAATSPNASPAQRLVELPGDDHLLWVGRLGRDRSTRSRSSSPDRADRAEPTAFSRRCCSPTSSARPTRAAEIGDARWRALLDEHDRARPRRARPVPRREVEDDGRRIPRDVRRSGARDPLRVGDRRARARDRTSGAGGLHTGEIELIGDGVAGIAVHIGARVSALAGADEVLVSSTVKDLVAGSTLLFTERGTYDLKGVPGSWRVYRVEGRAEATLAEVPR